ncbi:peptidyl-prolyl cis-trans isomerase [Helicobacter sp. MIT 05-5293]|uniref:peptidylprolyl isomerase n=1 Tax=Helicobacter sp. MIT 05-5293 TaxID=1548149 RepID=UPI00051D868F|nr:peptidylprolyl isomerase [Helicobacter sp. MIT 05-5293]TLD81004.1 peptidyl-prolyl cis-trans isomerase [Helicobacter sp. MIT 05-5293]
MLFRFPIITAFMLCLCSALYAEVVAGVAIRVNGHAITLYEISKLQSQMNLSRDAAIDLLINERLKDDEIERFKISIDEFKIDEEIALIASENNLSRDELIAKVAKEGMSYQEYRNEVKKQLQTKELMQRILASNINITSEEELLSYYTQHKKDFSIPQQVQAIRYFADSDSLLEKAIKSPKQNVQGVQKIEETINLSSLNPQIMQLFITTPKHEFTPVLTTGGKGFVSFYVKERLGERLLDFEEAKGYIHQKLMAQKEQTILEDHFNKIRSSAKIVTLRE